MMQQNLLKLYSFSTRQIFGILFFLLPFLCAATDLKPWFGNEYEAEFQSTLLYQNYHSIATSERDKFRRDENDLFLTLSAIYPFKRYSGEFEVTGAETRRQKNRVDNVRVTGRYQWMDEDPLSIVTSLTLTGPFNRALKDISSFHHGRVDVEGCISYGKKYGFFCSKDYEFRWWNVIGIGVANQGSPWIRGDAACEYNYFNVHQFRGFIHTLWGTGKQPLRPYNFYGYGKIKHESVDLGVRYSYTAGPWGTWSIEYARRVHARNFPKNTNLFLLEYYLPFGFQVYCNY